MRLLLFVSVVMGVLRYVRIDPMKRSFFLIGSMLMLIPLMTFSGSVWFSYFVRLLFLSGIFVILVYFSSLSKVGRMNVYMVFFVLLLTLLCVVLNFGVVKFGVGLNVFYYSMY